MASCPAMSGLQNRMPDVSYQSSAQALAYIYSLRHQPRLRHYTVVAVTAADRTCVVPLRSFGNRSFVVAGSRVWNGLP